MWKLHIKITRLFSTNEQHKLSLKMSPKSLSTTPNTTRPTRYKKCHPALQMGHMFQSRKGGVASLDSDTAGRERPRNAALRLWQQSDCQGRCWIAPLRLLVHTVSRRRLGQSGTSLRASCTWIAFVLPSPWPRRLVQTPPGQNDWQPVCLDEWNPRPSSGPPSTALRWARPDICRHHVTASMVQIWLVRRLTPRRTWWGHWRLCVCWRDDWRQLRPCVPDVSTPIRRYVSVRRRRMRRDAVRWRCVAMCRPAWCRLKNMVYTVEGVGPGEGRCSPSSVWGFRGYGLRNCFKNQR